MSNRRFPESAKTFRRPIACGIDVSSTFQRHGPVATSSCISRRWIGPPRFGSMALSWGLIKVRTIGLASTLLLISRSRGLKAFSYAWTIRPVWALRLAASSRCLSREFGTRRSAGFGRPYGSSPSPSRRRSRKSRSSRTSTVRPLL